MSNIIFTNENIHSNVNDYLNGNPNGLPPIGEWDVSNVTDMSNLFKKKINSMNPLKIGMYQTL
jgi:surface protein